MRQSTTLAEIHVEPRIGESWYNMGVLPRVQPRRGNRSRHHSRVHQRSLSQPESSTANPDLQNHGRRRRNSSLFSAFTTCTICRQHYAGNSSDIIVGFLPECGHFFHYACIQRELEKDARCPQCVHKLESRSRRSSVHTIDGASTLSREREHYNRPVTLDSIQFAFLIDVMCMRRSRSQ